MADGELLEYDVFTELCARVGFYFVQGRCLQHPMFVGANLVFARVEGMVRYWGKAERDGDHYCLLPYHCLDVAAVRHGGR